MTDQPGRPDDAEERLPATRPSSAPVPSRFTAPPSARRNDLTPERTGRIVRQSANARWLGFLAVVIVSLFVIGYYFYDVKPGDRRSRSHEVEGFMHRVARANDKVGACAGNYLTGAKQKFRETFPIQLGHEANVIR